MLSRKIFFAALVVSLLAAAGLTFDPPASRAQDRRTGVTPPVQNPPPTLVLESDTEVVTVCEGDPAPRVQLRASGRSPEGREIRFTGWRTSNGGGRVEDIRADGGRATAVWNLEGVRPGVYTATVEINTGLEGDACMAFTSVPVVVRPCVRKPWCPNVSIYCPDTVTLGQPITFTAEAAGGTPGVTPTFNWTVSEGTITSGQGTPSITVDSTGLGGRAITATVEVLGYNLTCKATCTTQVPSPPVEKPFDEYNDIAYNDEKARLDPFAVYLQGEPRARGYIIAHQGRRARAGAARRRAERARDYLVNERGIGSDRIIIVEGAPRDVTTFQLRGVPPGAPAPQP